MAALDAWAIDAALDAWLAPFLEVMGRKTRRRWAPLSRHGLLGPDGRKSLQPLAMRLGLGGHDQLQPFIASPAWDDAPLRRVLVEKAEALVGGRDAGLVVDDTACPKKGKRSVGVAAVRRLPRQAGELPGSRFPHLGPRRGAGAAWTAALIAPR
jgi:SRSO17 transposase